ncbi:YceI family protein [Hymenobacter sp. BT175]|uniref:YceI family protein n=1 Tax=Hymenobacter translucens TaxID=2886507 RepID=UPI001D0E58C6|nr:YceI family protein [Hymenobacter translucens]MCC2547139.1 YceI family protein [Hymenobacter translucens]
MNPLSLLLFASLLLAFRSAPAPAVYQVSPAASRLTWTGYAETGTWAPFGTLLLRRGSFTYDGRRLRRGYFEFDMTTITHAEEKLQEHLRNADFFDVVRFPSAVFKLNEVVNGEARGFLTVKGITRAIRFPVSVTRQGGSLRVHGTATIDRTRFSVNYNSSSFFQNLGSYAIRNDFQLAFVLVASPSK